MAQTLVRVLVHLIFSTKGRANLISPEVESELHAYLAGIANDLDSQCFAVNGTADHVHMLVSQSKNVALAELVAEVKKGSSRWIKTKSGPLVNFHWQDGYAAFSVSESNAASVRQYIADQKEHHRKRSFQEGWCPRCVLVGQDHPLAPSAHPLPGNPGARHLTPALCA